MLAHVTSSPTVKLNYAVANIEAKRPESALSLLDPRLDEPRTRRNHRLYSVRASILKSCGRHHEALNAYRRENSLCTSIPEQRYLNSQIRRRQTMIGSATVTADSQPLSPYEFSSRT